MPVYRDVVVELDGTDIAGKLNKITIKESRSEITSENYGSDDTEKDVGPANDSITLAGTLSVGATEAYKALRALKVTPGTGATIAIYIPDKTPGNDYWHGTVFCSDVQADLATNQMGTISATLPVSGHLDFDTYTTTGG